MRRRLSYANVAATLALVLAMSSGALAAGHYLITSTKQISPKVLKQLQGKIGPQGPQGIPGAAGLTGAKGNQGIQGNQGSQGIQGNPGTARAYAQVAQNGTITLGQNITLIGHTPGSGSYCLNLGAGIDPTTTGLVVTPDYSTDGTTNSQFAHVEWASAGCATGGVSVRTFLVAVNSGVMSVTAKDEGFFVAVP